MMSDEYLVDCKINDEDEEEDEEDPFHPTPPPGFSSTPLPSQIESRDPYGINQHLRVEFSDVLAEPSSSHSYDRIWVYSDIGFESALIWGYRFLTLLCAIPLSLLSGCLFALLACLHIWCVMPCIQVYHTCLPCVRSLWMGVVNICIAPFCKAVARCCSRIYVTVSGE